jgi:hypothetical protein
MNLIVIKKDGTQTHPAMAQPQAFSYLKNLIGVNRQASLSQALNQAFDGNGKATGAYLYNAHAVLHASSGNGQHSVCLFYYMNVGTIMLVAMGEHADQGKVTSYLLSDYGQPTGSFKSGNRITP